MLVIGIAGGIASGKSSAAKCFERLGATVLNADLMGHQVLYEPEVKRQILENWGEKVFNEGEVDRSALARVVFDPASTASELAKLEQITHPIICQRMGSLLAQLELANVPAAVLDAPLMFKAGWDTFCDKIVFVHADLETRRQRVAKRG
jgi:dephospho-CoA kinase